MTHPGASTNVPPRLIRVRKAILLTAAVIGLEVLGFAAWWTHSHWRLGRIELTNNGVPLTVQVLDESGEHPLGEPFDVIKKATLSLPDGDYRLRVTGIGRLGRTARFAVNRGETIAHELSLDEGRLLGHEKIGPYPAAGPAPKEQPIPFAPMTVALELTPGKADMIESSPDSLIRRDGATGRAIWDAFKTAKPAEAGHNPFTWLRVLRGDPSLQALVTPAPDLNGDGTGDIVWAFTSLPSIFALSGADGSLLWTYHADPNGPGGPSPDGPEPPDPVTKITRQGRILGAPVLTDVDRDGTPDLIATMVFSEFEQEAERREVEATRRGLALNSRPPDLRMVLAVSGRSGRWLWSNRVDRSFTSYDESSWNWPASLVRGRQSAMVAIASGTQWLGLDPAIGRPVAGPIDLGFVPVRPLQHADLDGDGMPEILALGPGPATGQQILSAFSTNTGREHWNATVDAKHAVPDELNVSMFVPKDRRSPPDWPLVMDRNRDGRSCVVVPDCGPMPRGEGYRGVKALDGPTGRARWVRPMRPQTKAEDGLEQLVEAPDLDSDGTLDLVAISRFYGRQPRRLDREEPEESRRIYVDAISGRDGRPLWLWHTDVPEFPFAEVGTPRWWGRGPDGWPLLAVAIGGRPDATSALSWIEPPIVHNLEASTGREVHEIDGLFSPNVADLDGDGLADLWGDVDGDLLAFRGEPPEMWRALGGFSAAGRRPGLTDHLMQRKADFDGDGIADARITGLHAGWAAIDKKTGSRTVVLRSGLDGHVLWKSRLEKREGWSERDAGEYFTLETFPMPAGDLDGDGTPDVIVERYFPSGMPRNRAATLPLDILSGRTGRHLGAPGPLYLGFDARGYSSFTWVDVRIVEPQARPDILVRHQNAFVPVGAPPPSAVPSRSRLTRLSGRDGRIIWDIPLIDRERPSRSGRIEPGRFGDLDGDGVLDVVDAVEPADAPAGTPMELRAISLADGKPLWTHPLEYKTHPSFLPPLTVADLDGDGRAEVLVVLKPELGDGAEDVIQALDGRDGTVRWSWRGGPPDETNPFVAGAFFLADLDGKGRRRLCVSFDGPAGTHRVVVLDPRGRETARRELSVDHINGLVAADITGDGREELLVSSEGLLQVLGPDLKDLWSWPLAPPSGRTIIPATRGHPGLLIVDPGVGLDGADGHPRWTGQTPLAHPIRQLNARVPELLDPGDATRLPRLLSSSIGSTACRLALLKTPQGTLEPPRGAPVRPGLERDDPRWTRRLPWTDPILRTIGLSGFLAAIGLALFNVVVPIAILRLAARRKPWTMRLLMAIPVAAAVPLTVYQALQLRMPSQIGTVPVSARRAIILGTLAGLPIVVYAGFAAWSLVRRRWRALAVLVALTVAASAVVGAAWLWLDRRSMPAIEHYDRSTWYLAAVPGVEAVGVLLLVGWPLRRFVRLIRRTRDRS